MKNKAIVCVDDEKIILISLKSQLLKKFGNDFVIETAENGMDAMLIVDELIYKHFELVVVIADQIMPGMRGDELLAIVHEKSKRTLNILLTGQADVESVGRAVNKAKLYHFITKPWNEEDLILTIREAIRRYEQESIILQQKDEMEKLIIQLKEYNETLEQKVIERTIEIEEQKGHIELQRDSYKILSATKDKFFNIIAHDLKNPFSNILCLTDLNFDEIDGCNFDELKQSIKVIHKSAQNAFKLLENLLEWARSQTGKIKFNPEYVKLEPLVQTVLLETEGMIYCKGIDVMKKIYGNMEVFVDINMFITILRNLITNAVKYTHRNGKICIKAKKEDESILISISDNGVGIESNKRDKLFLISEKVSTPGTENETGTGLGLLLCKEFVHWHKGKIWIESEVGIGTTVFIELPLNQTTVK